MRGCYGSQAQFNEYVPNLLELGFPATPSFNVLGARSGRPLCQLDDRLLRNRVLPALMPKMIGNAHWRTPMPHARTGGGMPAERPGRGRQAIRRNVSPKIIASWRQVLELQRFQPDSRQPRRPELQPRYRAEELQ